ncbi:N-acetylglucosamine-6-phosphate deacetylase [Sphingopyxis sp. JAI128]|uniref:N-acetylglucosamine-6-phosphate deacetylase n=1 Tax=Sphingopyxis sp. JAI128 TaxID=2723066 RepID=UPI00160A3E40|nr:N-acetylglucosamine-6-phosphate deacetylase [Sphingopyxis sp. JAI128]MBB6425288.1 N-acetylglucosamine-6-phosphate deacetylase [Sphingopyxis sp. JAI128]
MIFRFHNGQVALPAGAVDAVDIAIADGIVSAVSPAGHAAAHHEIDLDGGWLLPGFVDTQVNGGGGVLFNDQVDVEAIAAIGAAHARFGTTAFLPTLISDTPAQIAAALAAVDAAIERGVPGVVGIHIEGPFINEVKRGIHEAHRIRRLDADTLATLTAPHRGRVMLTLAPELCDEEDIRALVRHGVIVSAGHSDATYDEAQRAIAAGLSGFTHLFNAMSPLHHRGPGAVGAAFDSDTYCGLIVDDVHLHPAVVRLAVHAKGKERIMLVTDAMPSVGTNVSEFTLQGKRIAVKDGVCIFEDGTLAGTHLDMASALRKTIEVTGLSVPDVSAMASATPAAFLSLGNRIGAIAAGRRADWVWLGAALETRATWIDGQIVSQAAPDMAQAAQ